jgi:hypothetical protein
MAELLRCPRCLSALPRAHVTDLLPCPTCQLQVQMLVFPAWFKTFAPAPVPQQVVSEGESSCFYHPGKQAVVPCDACGRFLCALCDCEIQRQHFCPGCVSSARNKGRLVQFERSRTNHDSVALSLAGFSILLGPLALIAGPAAIFWSLWFWKRPGSVLPRSKVRSIVAIVIGLVTTFGWGYWAYKIIIDGNL